MKRKRRVLHVSSSNHSDKPKSWKIKSYIIDQQSFKGDGKKNPLGCKKRDLYFYIKNNTVIHVYYLY